MSAEAATLVAAGIQAVGTLAGGGLAVFAAWKVGQKQIQILAEQTEIQNASLRHEVFEKRFEIYAVLSEVVWEITQKKSVPNTSVLHRLQESDMRAAFLFQESFLFEYSGIVNKVGVYCDLNLSRLESGDLNSVASDKEEKLLLEIDEFRKSRMLSLFMPVIGVEFRG